MNRGDHRTHLDFRVKGITLSDIDLAIADTIEDFFGDDPRPTLTIQRMIDGADLDISGPSRARIINEPFTAQVRASW